MMHFHILSAVIKISSKEKIIESHFNRAGQLDKMSMNTHIQTHNMYVCVYVCVCAYVHTNSPEYNIFSTRSVL